MLRPTLSILGMGKESETEKNKYKQNTVVSLLLKQTLSHIFSLS